MSDTLFSAAIGGRGFIPDYDSPVFDMKGTHLEFGDKVFYNSKKGKVESCFFLALSDDPKNQHRNTCYVLAMEGSIPYVNKVSSYYLIKTEWDNKHSPSITLTQGYSLLNYIEKNIR